MGSFVRLVSVRIRSMCLVGLKALYQWAGRDVLFCCLVLLQRSVSYSRLCVISAEQEKP